VKSCVKAVQLFKNSCVEVLYFGNFLLKMRFFGTFFLKIHCIFNSFSISAANHSKPTFLATLFSRANWWTRVSLFTRCITTTVWLKFEDLEFKTGACPTRQGLADWWRKQDGKYSKIQLVAEFCIVACVSNAKIESLFSEMRRSVSRDRAHLKSENINRLFVVRGIKN